MPLCECMLEGQEPLHKNKLQLKEKEENSEKEEKRGNAQGGGRAGGRADLSNVVVG